MWCRQVKTSSTSRWDCAAWQTPLVATSGRLEGAGEFDGGLIAGFLFAIEVALQFDEDAGVAESSDEVFERLAASAGAESVGERAFFAAGETDQTAEYSARSGHTESMCKRVRRRQRFWYPARDSTSSVQRAPSGR